MKRILLLLFISLFSSMGFAKETIKINSTANSFKVTSVTKEKVRVKVNVGNFSRTPVTINGSTYYIIDFEEGKMIDKGYPELPKYARSLAVPKGATVTARVVSSSYKDYSMQVVPSKGSLSRSVDPNSVAYTFSSVYNRNSFYPSTQYSVGSSYKMRDINGTVVSVNPFAYNGSTKTLRVYTSLEIEFTISGGTGIVTTRGNEFFDGIFKNQFINYTGGVTRSSTNDAGSMLVISYPSFVSAMQPFVDHKNEIGISTQIVSTNTTGTTAASIKQYISNYYSSHPQLTFVLLVGDHAQVPTFMDSQGFGCDPMYSLISGNDNYPDIIVGRFSAINTTEVTTMVNRSILYDMLDREQAWVRKGTCIGSDEGTGDNGEYDWQHERVIRGKLLNWEYNAVDELYDGSHGGQDATGDPTPQMVSSALNNGRSIVNYTGHGNSTFWGTTGFSNDNINNLTNTNKWPFVFSVACLVGDFTGLSYAPDIYPYPYFFSGTTCFAEAWLKAKASNGCPTGAIAFYGSSTLQPWFEPMRAQDAFNDYLTQETYSSFGCLCYNASCAMMDAYPGSASVFKAWNIFGDPSARVVPHTQCPNVLTVNTDIKGGDYKASAQTKVIGKKQILSSAHVTYSAPTVTLKTGFKVSGGSTFHANTVGCSAATMRSGKIVEDDFDNVIVSSDEDGINGSSLSIYPNPTDGEFIVAFSSEDVAFSLDVVDIAGKSVYTTSGTGREQVVNLEGKASGVYFVRVTVDDRSYVEKVILK